MILRCKAGDAAIIIKGRNSGKYVEVLQGIGDLKVGDTIEIQGYRLRIEKVGGYYWWCKGRTALLDMLGRKAPYGAIKDSALMPIRPPGEPVDLEKEHAEPA